jgi:hypothetical protein
MESGLEDDLSAVRSTVLGIQSTIGTKSIGAQADTTELRRYEVVVTSLTPTRVRGAGK